MKVLYKIANIKITNDMVENIKNKTIDRFIANLDDYEQGFIQRNNINEIMSYLADKIDDTILNVVEEDYNDLYKVLMGEAEDDTLDNSTILNKLLNPLSEQILEALAKEFNKSLEVEDIGQDYEDI